MLLILLLLLLLRPTTPEDGACPAAADSSAEMPKKRGKGGKKQQAAKRPAAQPSVASLAPPEPEPRALPAGALSVVATEAGSAEQLLLAREALSPAACAGWIAFAEGVGLVSTRPPGGRPARGTAYRDNYRLQIHDSEVAAALWASGLGDLIAAVLPAQGDGRRAVGFNDNLRLYRYDVGLRFGKHCARSPPLTPLSLPFPAARTSEGSCCGLN